MVISLLSGGGGDGLGDYIWLRDNLFIFIVVK